MKKIVLFLILFLMVVGGVEAVGSVNTANKLNGTFLRFDPPTAFASSDEINKYFAELSSLGMDTVIIDRIQKKIGCTTPDFLWEPNLPDKLATIFNAALHNNIKIYVGLARTAQCDALYDNPNKNIVTQYYTDYTNPNNPIQYILDHFGTNPQFAGWYLPEEPGLGYWPHPEITYEYYRGLANSIKAKSNKPIILAPGFCGVDGYLTPDQLADRTKNFKDNTGIDIFAYQDCVNQSGISLTLNDLQNRFTSGQYYQAISNKIGKDALWADLEISNCCQNPPPALWNSGLGKATSISRLVQQLNSAPLTIAAKRVTWINQGQLTQIVSIRKQGSDRLLAAYKSLYTNTNEYEYLIPTSYTWITPPSTQYPDTNNRELSDLRTGERKNFRGYENYLDSGYVGINGSAEINVNFDSTHKLQWVGVHMIHLDKQNISFPHTLTFSCSLDNVIWSTPLSFTLPVSRQNSEYVFGNPNNNPLNQDCRYLKLKLINDSDKWTFVSEIEVIAGISSTTPTKAVIVGDYNGDRMVNLADFGEWKKKYLAVPPTMTLGDFGVWKTAYLGN